MKFITKIDNLCSQYSEQHLSKEAYVSLYGILNSPPPLATHMIFPPITKDVEEQLIYSYKKTFPSELLNLYHVMNGACLFWTTRKIPKTKRQVPVCQLSIYGVPLIGAPLTPFNISIEDLNRLKGTPDSWLKFGSYRNPNNAILLDLFVDTEMSTVYSVDREGDYCNSLEEWASIDTCLCSIFDLLQEKECGSVVS